MRRERGRASVLTVIAMSLKGSIIAAGARKRKWGREDRESTIITEGEGASSMQMISRKEINQGRTRREHVSSGNHS